MATLNLVGGAATERLIDALNAGTADRDRWRWEARKEAWRWSSNPDGCSKCGQRIGHWGGDATTDPCDLIPTNVPLEEVRPNCYMVRFPTIGDAIREVCDRKGVQ